MNLTPTSRVALYYAPAEDDLLWAAGSLWLGRDAASGARLIQPDGLDPLTVPPRRYGFHATLKPPFHPAPGADWAAILAQTRRTAASLAPFAMPALTVGRLDQCVAIVEAAAPAPALRLLADALVTGLDRLRGSLTEADRLRRGPLSPARAAMLERWGSPDVLDQWRFHMTLSRRLDPLEAAAVLAQAETWFGPALGAPRMVQDVAVFFEPEPDAAFILAERIPLGRS